MNVLILGSGGREHALAWKARQSRLVSTLHAAPGSAAIAPLAACSPLDHLNPDAVTAFCRKNAVELVIVGPEAPLEAGVADALREAKIAVFGPGKDAARLESSKAFAKAFMTKHNIPTARWEVFSEAAAAKAAAANWAGPVVVKADGLAAGKGVVVCDDAAQAVAAVSEIMESKTLGGAGARVVLEERLEGPELSVMAFCDGRGFAVLPPSRDHKRLLDGDEGPNTGGMGAFAPVSVAPAVWKRIETEVLPPILAGLQADGLDYRGLLYVGLMLTPQGPKVLEFNCRFGDPETQAVLPLLDEDLIDLALACAEKRLAPRPLAVKKGACLAVTVASEGYPAKPVTGRAILGLDRRLPDQTYLFHAGTQQRDGEWVTSGGRVLSVVALGADLAQARERAYQAASGIRFHGAHYRLDIGVSALPSLK